MITRDCLPQRAMIAIMAAEPILLQEVELAKKTVRDIPVSGKRVFVRVDYNVPLDPGTGAIADDTRIKATLPTLRYLLEHKARVVIASHLGRPKGQRRPEFSLAPIARHLSPLLGQTVPLVSDCVGPEVESVVERLGPGQALLLENLRFHAGEEANDPVFAQALSRLADVYVDDAFGAAHRAHASISGIARHLPAVSGFLLEKELRHLGQVLRDPARPLAAVMGGAKVSDKMAVLDHLAERADLLLLGGGMVATLLKVQGTDVGASRVEDDRLAMAQHLLRRAADRGIRLLLPSDVVVAQEFSATAAHRTVPVDSIPQGWLIMDIGPQTLERFEAELRRCRTIVWNGPMGVFEFPPFSQGTRRLAEVLASLDGATTVVGGGSTAEAVESWGLASRYSHVSTGGGATLEFLEGKTLPGVAVLQDKET